MKMTYIHVQLKLMFKREVFHLARSILKVRILRALISHCFCSISNVPWMVINVSSRRHVTIHVHSAVDRHRSLH